MIDCSPKFLLPDYGKILLVVIAEMMAHSSPEEFKLLVLDFLPDSDSITTSNNNAKSGGGPTWFKIGSMLSEEVFKRFPHTKKLNKTSINRTLTNYFTGAVIENKVKADKYGHIISGYLLKLYCKL
jgi:hypothetical protein